MDSRPRLDSQTGSVLVAALVVIFILLTIFFAVFSIAVSSKMMITRKILKTRAGYLADTGIERFVFAANKDSLDWREALRLRISDTIGRNESFDVTSGIYGGYILVNSTGKAGTQAVRKQALVGKAPWTDLNLALLNSDMNYPLVVAGRAKINGNVVVGPEGIVRGSLQGEANSEEKPVSGTVKTRSAPEPVQLDRTLMEHLRQEFALLSSNPTYTLSGNQVIRELVLRKSGSPVTYFIEGNTELESLRLKAYGQEVNLLIRGSVTVRGKSELEGAVRIYSSQNITLEGPAVLDGTLLFAEAEITFREVRRFQGQALAGSKIKAGPDARIEYPSLLYVSSGEIISDTTQIHFLSGSRSRTLAFLEKSDSNAKDHADIVTIDTNATVIGCIASQDLTELRGELRGISITRSYHLQLFPTRYVNWLYNATIDRSQLDFFPVLPVNVLESGQYAVFDIWGE
ncbi:MAG: hypothetical protein HRF51_01585 [bacterium]|jgi:hypothetical protein